MPAFLVPVFGWLSGFLAVWGAKLAALLFAGLVSFGVMLWDLLKKLGLAAIVYTGVSILFDYFLGTIFDMWKPIYEELSVYLDFLGVTLSFALYMGAMKVRIVLTIVKYFFAP